MRTRTLTDHIYESLRDDILELRLRPGEKLSEVKLAERYGVSRAPIRNVIARLEQAKLVVVRPQIGTLISPISFEKLLDILEVRLLLEPQAAAAAAERIDAGDLELLDEAFRSGKVDLPTLLLIRNQLLDAELAYWDSWLQFRAELIRLDAATAKPTTDDEPGDA